jgi:NADPH:quinone reductase
MGAACGVGPVAVEPGKVMGARIIATASTPAKPGVAQAHGANGTVLFPSEGALDAI